MLDAVRPVAQLGLPHRAARPRWQRVRSGTANLNNGTLAVSSFRLERYDSATGAFDWAVDSDPGDLDDQVRGMTVDASCVYLAGYVTKVVAKSLALRVETHTLSDGALVWADRSL